MYVLYESVPKKDLADLLHLNSSKYSFMADPKATIPGDSSKKATAKPCSVAWSTAPLPRFLPFLSWPFKFPHYPSTAWVPAVHRKLEEAGLFRFWSWKTSISFGEAASLGSRDDLVNCFGSPGLLECRTVAKGTAGGRAPTRCGQRHRQGRHTALPHEKQICHRDHKTMG